MHSKILKNSSLLFGCILFFVLSCSQKRENYVARVGNNFLTQEMIDNSIGKSEGDKLFHEEFIRKWIEKRLVYLSAINQGILDREDYSQLVSDAKIEIANALVINQLVENNRIEFSKEVLEKYYSNNISEFKLSAPKIMYNQVSFNDKSVAKKFRRKLVSQSWGKVVREFANNTALIFVTKNNFEYIYNILPVSIREQLVRLRINGVSRVIESSQDVFTVLQHVKSYKKYEVPKFNEIEMDIQVKYLAKSRKELYSNFIKELYSEYSSEIER